MRSRSADILSVLIAGPAAFAWRNSILDPTIDHGAAFRTAVCRFGKAGFTIRFFQQPAAHHHVAVRANWLARTTCWALFAQTPLNTDWLLGGHVKKYSHNANVPFDLHQN